MSDFARIYISMPRPFLREIDRTANAEHLSRSALIREAVKLCMAVRTGTARPRFFTTSEELRRALAGRSEQEIDQRIDRAVRRARGVRDD